MNDPGPEKSLQEVRDAASQFTEPAFQAEGYLHSLEHLWNGRQNMEASTEFRRCQDQAAPGREQAKDLDHNSECVNPTLTVAAQFSTG